MKRKQVLKIIFSFLVFLSCAGIVVKVSFGIGFPLVIGILGCVWLDEIDNLMGP